MSNDYTIAAAPRRIPLLGHVTQLLREPLELFQSIRGHGDIVVIGLGRASAYVINHPDLIRQLLVQDAQKFNKGIQFEKARPYLGNGLLSSAEPLHLRQRRLIQPAFHHTQIAQYTAIMQDSAITTLQPWTDGSMVSMKDALLSFTLRVLTRTLFSTEAKPELVAEFMQALPDFLAGLTVRIALPFALLERLPTPGNRRFDRARARLTAIVGQILAGHRARVVDHADMLSILVHGQDENAGPAITDEQLRDEVMTMLLAGTETTASTLSWACHLLCQHPEIQDRVCAEVRSVLDDRPVGVEDLRRLEYTRHVLTETLRMYPAVWLLSRSPLADIELGGHMIPAGSHVFFCPYALHRDPALYPEPTCFRPERWEKSQAAMKGGSRETFIPFGAGIRGCIGEPFAWTEMMIFLANLVTRWYLRPVPGHVVQPIIKASLQPDVLPVIVEKRRDP